MDEDRETAIRVLMQVPGLARSSAEVLVDNGFTSIEEVAYVPQAELLGECGLASSEALALRSLAQRFLLRSVG